MLNKLLYFKEHPYANKKKRETYDNSLFDVSLPKNLTIIKETNGTLSNANIIEDSKGRQLFIKTYKNDKKYNTIEKEYQLLRTVYGDALDFLEKRIINNEEYLIMDKCLQNSNYPSPDLVMSAIEEYSKALKNKFTIKGMYSISDLCNSALSELKMMTDNGFYSLHAAEMCIDRISALNNASEKMNKIICHGDLSNSNIMSTKKGKTIVVDWEDAFEGIEYYDYIYWLTFVSNRKHYSYKTFDSIDLDRKVKEGMIATIITLKNAFSYYSGSYLNNKLGMEERLLELLSYIH